MSDPVVVALIVSAGPVLIGVINLFAAFAAKRAASNAKTTALELDHKINSRLDLIVRQAEQLAHAAGMKEERDRNRG